MQTPTNKLAGRVFIVTGPPCSGKGTQCSLLADKYGLIHLSTGDMFREEVAKGTELGLVIKRSIDSGYFVPDELVLNMVKARIRQPDVQEKGCLLDGFPRTIAQAEEIKRQVHVALFIGLSVVSDDALVRRASNRRIDPATGKIYNLETCPPPAELLPSLVQRTFDGDEAAFRLRLSTFHDLQSRVAPLFADKYKSIEAERQPSAVFADLERTLLESVTTSSQPATPPAAPAASPHSLSCVICMGSEADHLLTPCGHQCGCKPCLEQLVQMGDKRCPICRTPIATLQKVYLSGLSNDPEPTGVAPVLLPVPPPPVDAVPIATPMDEEDDDFWPEDQLEDPVDASSSMPPLPSRSLSQTGGATVEVSPAQDVGSQGSEAVDVVVRVQVPDCTEWARPPLDLCCVVDVSGSMGMMAEAEDENGNKRDDGLQILDVVKHAVKALAHMLTPADRLSLVAFNHEARTILPLTEMNEEGRATYMRHLATLDSGGQTNLWGGLYHGMESLRCPTRQEASIDSVPRAKSIMLLTDGQPNRVPPNGHQAELTNYLDQYPDLQLQINTFGFGYNLDSQLLLDLSTMGRGAFAFIPDGGLVGSNFVNTLANVLATVTLQATVQLRLLGGAKFAGPVSGEYTSSDEIDTGSDEICVRTVDLGPLQFGQARELAMPVSIPPSTDPTVVAAGGRYLEVVLEYRTPSRPLDAYRVAGYGVTRTPFVGALTASLRCQAVTTGLAAVKKAAGNRGREAKQDVDDLASRLQGAVATQAAAAARAEAEAETGTLALAHLPVPIAAPASASDAALVALRDDICGRFTKSMKGVERFNRWGKHYMRALMRSHQLQQCTNFKDTGLQVYGGKLFQLMRARGREVFFTLPPPVSRYARPAATSLSSGGGGGGGAAAPAVDMSSWVEPGGCFGADATVIVVRAGGKMARTALRHIRAGDQVKVAGGGSAAVRCVVKLSRSMDRPLVTLPGGPTLTSRHPIRVDGKWHRPSSVRGAKLAAHEGYVLTLVLAGGADVSRVLLVDGLECITWGHGLEEPGVQHPFYGTQRIIECLEAMRGWASGYIEVGSSVRETASGEVVQLIERSVETC